ncbi:MAG: polyphosphate polymerase domain-containing protein [bacterium]|nr:polyphosphate polymerase domain-containing protein [bacterium]
MERKESKYLLHINQLQNLFTHLQADYDILEIGNIREFTYKNIYFDTADLFFYHQHLQQNKNRTKVRTRKYVDSHLDFVEYKQKMKSIIKKERVSIGEEQFGQLTPETVEFLQKCFAKYYHLKEDFTLQPMLGNTYKRITLCHKTKKERVTVDTQINYEDISNT